MNLWALSSLVPIVYQIDRTFILLVLAIEKADPEPLSPNIRLGVGVFRSIKEHSKQLFLVDTQHSVPSKSINRFSDPHTYLPRNDVYRYVITSSSFLLPQVISAAPEISQNWSRAIC
ncbi:hypothetical protein BJY04DRAFT_185125 [Aspergillus karnatakaensis]|uniref:uncharacterized protein n=1 Tax=Aspergillus karnatakaensis TaxID=1810916 RepID=UPI003CCDBF8E